MQVKKSKQVRKYLDKQDKITRERLDVALNDLPEGDVIPIVNMPNTFVCGLENTVRCLFVRTIL